MEQTENDSAEPEAPTGGRTTRGRASGKWDPTTRTMNSRCQRTVKYIVAATALASTVLALTSCFGRKSQYIPYSYLDYRPIPYPDSMREIPCLDSALAYLRHSHFDTSQFELRVMEDDTTILFSFWPKAEETRMTEDGSLIVSCILGPDIFYSKYDCRRLRAVLR